jgi:hypothetical protein
LLFINELDRLNKPFIPQTGFEDAVAGIDRLGIQTSVISAEILRVLFHYTESVVTIA